MNIMKSNLMTTIKSYYQVHNTLDASFKRCVYIDVLSILFIILPTKYFMTKRRASAWLLLFLFFMVTAKGGKDPHPPNSNDYLVSTKKNRYSLI